MGRRSGQREWGLRAARERDELEAAGPGRVGTAHREAGQTSGRDRDRRVIGRGETGLGPGPAMVLGLQRTAGNRAVASLLAGTTGASLLAGTTGASRLAGTTGASRLAGTTGASRLAGTTGASRRAGATPTGSPGPGRAMVVQRDTLESVIGGLRRALAGLGLGGSGGGAGGGGGGASARPSSWTSDPQPAPGGVLTIRSHLGGTRQAAGVTDVPGPPPPDLVLTPARGSDGRWRAAVTAPAPISVRPRSMFPAPGLHDLPANPNRPGVAQKNDVTPAVSALVRRGEEEHLDDIHWALELTYHCIVRVLTRLSTQQAPAAGDGAAALAAARQWVNAALPVPLRFTGDDPFPAWVRAYTTLTRVTYDRDDVANGWHSLPRTMVSDRAELAALGVRPGQADVYRTQAGGQIGQHDPEALVRARFATL